MSVHEAPPAPTTETATMATNMRERFLKELRDNLDAWHMAEIDYATFTDCHRDTWEAIRLAGPTIEYEVMRALCDQLPPAIDPAGAAGPSPESSRFRGRIERARALCSCAMPGSGIIRGGDPSITRSDEAAPAPAKTTNTSNHNEQTNAQGE